ncbi:hypothetical protein F4553_001547 [Allocatelliglobosispora scoriae]|uniref:Pycsar effector protein domain-containing protein n=1 Tax=Allocatelliglobosispora scoriae TaxID=643052 RepID=A0A841BLC5_9ACTN|nr:Pycsar system effector family protein [Allocatelliglobosispora scoriae]MBB5868168.1 hypothetical protein [Allocatelliglobosispora scoriae]
MTADPDLYAEPSIPGQPFRDAAVRSSLPNTMDAWEALKLVSEWVKHAETKAGIILGASGVLGGALYTLATLQRSPGPAFIIALAVCVALVLIAAFSASMALRPRLRSMQKSVNLLYYAHIAQGFRGRPDRYTEAFTTLVADPSALATAIASQIWSISQVAHQKYRWNSIGMVALLGALAAIAVAALVAVSSNLAWHP